MCYTKDNMFDRIIYRLLDTIVDWCERYKKYRIDKTLPKPNKKELAKWVKQQEKSYK
jgi:hypothetical protein